MKPFEFTYQTYDSISPVDMKTNILFNKNYKETGEPPIDKFHKKAVELNKLINDYIAGNKPVPDQLANLILLGYVSAVESYLREIISKLIFFDEASKIACEGQSITYGAAITLMKPEEPPEALLENFSFANEKNIKDSLTKCLGIKGNLPNEVQEVLKSFSKVCQLRHCIVHRFGKLGSNNAIKLGLKEHKECLAKPLNLNNSALQDIFQVCSNTVKIINNFLFQQTLSRSAREDPNYWSWDLRKDKIKFKNYYNAFFSTIHPPETDGTLKDVYNEFRKAYQDAFGRG